jgi:hypothetical protein
METKAICEENNNTNTLTQLHLYIPLQKARKTTGLLRIRHIISKAVYLKKTIKI